MLARHIPGIIIIFSLERIMVNKCAAPICRTEQTMDLICQPQRFKANKTLCFM